MVQLSMTREEAISLKAEITAITASSVHPRPMILSLLNALDDWLKNKEVHQHAEKKSDSSQP